METREKSLADLLTGRTREDAPASATGHTVGPWRAEQAMYGDTPAGCLTILSEPECRLVADVTACQAGSARLHEMEAANARLIAASPALLAALEGLVADLGGIIDGSEGIAGWHMNGDVEPWGRTDLPGWLDEARAAVALARGEG